MSFSYDQDRDGRDWVEAAMRAVSERHRVPANWSWDFDPVQTLVIQVNGQTDRLPFSHERLRAAAEGNERVRSLIAKELDNIVRTMLRPANDDQPDLSDQGI